MMTTLFFLHKKRPPKLMCKEAKPEAGPQTKCREGGVSTTIGLQSLLGHPLPSLAAADVYPVLTRLTQEYLFVCAGTTITKITGSPS
jgi:hypothetical protein